MTRRGGGKHRIGTPILPPPRPRWGGNVLVRGVHGWHGFPLELVAPLLVLWTSPAPRPNTICARATFANPPRIHARQAVPARARRRLRTWERAG